jgi:hypothetical protein
MKRKKTEERGRTAMKTFEKVNYWITFCFQLKLNLNMQEEDDEKVNAKDDNCESDSIASVVLLAWTGKAKAVQSRRRQNGGKWNVGTQSVQTNDICAFECELVQRIAF